MPNKPKNEMLDWFKDYISKTSTEQLQKDWAEIENLGLTGPNALEYVSFMQQYYCWDNRPKQTVIQSNMTPTYSGSCFLYNIA